MVYTNFLQTQILHKMYALIFLNVFLFILSIHNIVKNKIQKANGVDRIFNEYHMAILPLFGWNNEHYFPHPHILLLLYEYRIVALISCPFTNEFFSTYVNNIWKVYHHNNRKVYHPIRVLRYKMVARMSAV